MGLFVPCSGAGVRGSPDSMKRLGRPVYAKDLNTL